MSALRLILLGAGLLFLALLAWLGSRRPRRTQPEPEGGRSEPSMALRGDAGTGEGAAAALGAGDALVARRGPPTAASLDSLGPMSSAPGPAVRSPLEPSMSPPVVDWSEATADAEAAEQAAAAGEPHATIIDVPVMPAESRRGPPRGTVPAEPVHSASASALEGVSMNGHAGGAPGSGPGIGQGNGAASSGAMAGDAARLPELYVAWPPEAERQIVSLRVLGTRGERIPGRLLRQGLAATGFRHGPFGIFHIGLDDGRVLISAASLVRPGLLDPENMDFQHFPGVNLFAVLPAPIAAAELLERFCGAAFDLAGRIGGSVQDEGGAPLGVQESQDWRAQRIAAFAQHAGAH